MLPSVCHLRQRCHFLLRGFSSAVRDRSTATDPLKEAVDQSISDAKQAKTFKEEVVLSSPQGPLVRCRGAALANREYLNLCANNYLGLSNHPEICEAAVDAIRTHGFGLSSVRFICGTTDLHKALEDRITRFHQTQDTILFPSGFDANTALFESILTQHDAVLSDELNHASIIDGIRLCKAHRFRFKHADIKDLELQLQEADKKGARVKMIATDGVFSMDGDIAPLCDIVALAESYNAYTFVDDCHATGFVGAAGRGTDELCGVQGRIDIISSTLGKALGGGTGGYITSGRPEIIQLLRQRARPYLFSNSLAPAVCGASLKAFDLLSKSSELHSRLYENTIFFREAMKSSGFNLPDYPYPHPIVPIHLGDAGIAKEMAAALLHRGIFVIAFSYPVVPKGKARIRVQISAAHTKEQLAWAVEEFQAAAIELDVMKKTEEAATGVGY